MADTNKKEGPSGSQPGPTHPTLYDDNQESTGIKNKKNNKGYNDSNRVKGIVGDGLTQSGEGVNIVGGINVEEGGTLNIEGPGGKGSYTTGLQKSTPHDHHYRDGDHDHDYHDHDHHHGNGDHGNHDVNGSSNGSSGNKHGLSSKQTTGIIIGVFVLIIIIILVVMFATRCFGSSDTAVNSSEDATNNPSGSNDGASNDTTNNPSGSNDGASNDTTNNPSGSNDSGNQKETT